MTVKEAHRLDRDSAADVSQGPYAPSPVPKPVIAFFAALRKILGRAEDTRETVRNPPTVDERGTWDIEVLVEPDPTDGGFIAETPDIAGAMAQGETEQEALENLGDAIQGVLAAKIEEHFRAVVVEDMPGGDGRRFSVHI